MKVALVIHDINNPGGIITYVERLAKGLIESGHECDILKLYHQEKTGDSRVRAEGYVPGESGLMVHPIFGWAFPAANRIPYKGNSINSAIERLSSYDIVIWETPTPSMPVNHSKRENLDWMRLFENSAKQIITIHDGNLLGLYPHLLEAVKGKNHISVTAPHPRGYNSAGHLGLDRSLVMIPQYPSEKKVTYEEKSPGFIACQIFKAWKHVDEPITAISYMKPTEISACKTRSIAGIGLTYYYMTSPDKCKFFHPDTAPEHLAGKRIWDTANENGMDYLGVLSFEERDKTFYETMLFLDPSYVNDELGNHLNGVVAEAMRLGCVPVGKPLTFRQNEDDKEAIYQPVRNYLEIPQNAKEKEYAAYLEYAATLPKDKWEEITQRNYQILDEWFDYRVVANQLVQQAVSGVKNSNAMKFDVGSGKPSEKLIEASKKTLLTFSNNL